MILSGLLMVNITRPTKALRLDHITCTMRLVYLHNIPFRDILKIGSLPCDVSPTGYAYPPYVPEYMPIASSDDMEDFHQHTFVVNHATNENRKNVHE